MTGGLDVGARTPPDHAVPRKPAWVLLIASFTAFLGGFNQSALNVVLPVIAADLRPSAVATSWILLSYLVTMCSLLVVFGRIGDLVGRRRLFLSGVSLFALSSAVSAAAPTAGILIVGRGFQGAGAAMMFATGAALIASAYPPKQLGGAMGVYFAVNSLAQFLGPVIGGVIAAQLGWHWVLWPNVAVALCAVVTGFFVLPHDAPESSGSRLDLLGSVLSAGAITTAITALSFGSGTGWTDLRIVALFSVSAGSAVAFIWWERRAASPLVDLSLFAERIFRWANVSSFLNCTARFPLVLLIALMFQTVHSSGAAIGGLAVVPVSIGTMLASISYRLLEGRYGAYLLGIAGSLMTSLGILIVLLSVTAHTYALLAACGGLIAGAGAGTLVVANGATILRRCDQAALGSVSGIRALVQMLGNTVGTSLCLAVVTAPLTGSDKSAIFGGHADSLDPAVFGDLGHGFHAAFGLLVVLALGGAAAAARARDDRFSRNDVTPS
ncbi:MFS transporter [Rhodococcus sp. NPDC057529]|uniref:MFS transporter n=1 Tax=Rhodococcus sp. NPDC057529 TaxID=3346158 RepID=UPI00366DFA42